MPEFARRTWEEPDGESVNSQPVVIQSGALETHLLFFYNLHVRIDCINKKEDYLFQNQKVFEVRNLDESELNEVYFSGKFWNDIVKVHFHGTEELARKYDEVKFSWAPKGKRPSDYAFSPAVRARSLQPMSSATSDIDVDGYAFCECTLFSNGVLAVVLRLQNRTDLLDEDYVEFIARPEYLRRSYPNLKPGPLIEKAYRRYLDVIQPCIVEALQSFEITGVRISSHHPERLDIRPLTFTGPGDEASKIKVDDFSPTRPYIGTILLASQTDSPKVNLERLQTFSISCARTTPQFLGTFNQPEIYLNEGSPRRNVYAPGPSIVFIARRGWCCVQREQDRDARQFRLGVIETVLFVIEGVISCVIASRSFLREVIRQGNAANADLTTILDAQQASYATEKVGRYLAFLAHARLNSPLDDWSTLLRSHLTTHTSIAAVERISQLFEHAELIEKARKTLDNYAASLEIANQFWNRFHAEKLAENVTVLRDHGETLTENVNVLKDHGEKLTENVKILKDAANTALDARGELRKAWWLAIFVAMLTLIHVCIALLHYLHYV